MALPSPFFASEPPPKLPPTHVKQESKPQPQPLKQIHQAAYCKYCREGFPTEKDLFQHRRSHEKCPYDNCNFNANAKTVASHIQRQHILNGNALVKIDDLSTPEQIEKWREERRKRYPTTSNVLLRQQAQQERMSRGEKLQDRGERFGDFKQRNHIRDMGRDQKRGGRDQNQNGRRQNNRGRRHDGGTGKRPEMPSDEKSEPPSKIQKLSPKKMEVAEKKTPVPPRRWLATKASAPGSKDESSDEEQRATPRFQGTSQMKDYHTVETLVKKQAALSVLGMYGSDSGSEDEEMEVGEIVENSENPEKSEEIVKEKLEEPLEPPETQDPEIPDDLPDPSDNEAPDEAPIQRKTDSPPPPQPSENSKPPRREPQHHKPRAPRSVLDYRKLKKPSVNPFLEKLLSEDILHERNVLLQCVSYVVSQNFFGIGQKTGEAQKKDDFLEKTGELPMGDDAGKLEMASDGEKTLPAEV